MNKIINQIQPHELAFDVDGVFADTFNVFISIVRDKYNINVKYEDITEYDFWNVIEIDEAVSRKVIQDILDKPLQIGIKPIDGSVKILTRLLEIGPVHFITARNNQSAIMDWIKYHLDLDNLEYIKIDATGSHLEKLPILLENNIKYFVDDRLETCYILDKASITPIIFEQPWNQTKHPFQTVHDWSEISDLIAW